MRIRNRSTPAEPVPGGESGVDSRAPVWGGVRSRLLYYYRDVPTTFQAQFDTLNLIVWRLIKGTVRVVCSGNEYEAKVGEWVVVTGGQREQEFSSDAYIESIHIHVDAPAAEWAGPQVAVLSSSAALVRASAALSRAVADKSGPGRTPGGPGFQVDDFAEQVRQQGAVWGFLGQLVPLLQTQGVVLVEPVIDDDRIARSMVQVDALPLDKPWPRDAVALATGMSASQLDRVWRRVQGRTPFQYWDARRLRFARERLEHSADSIKQVALALGFVHMPQFSNWFHARLGVSPRSYRQNCAQ